MEYCLAIDIGASSGRHIVGRVENGGIRTDEVYRFPNGAVKENGSTVWDIDALFENVKRGIAAAFKKYPGIGSIAVDTWGCDYVLLTADGEKRPVYSYRDNRTEGTVDAVHSLVPFEKLYAATGIQFQPFNTVYQLYADKICGRLRGVTDFLMIPEYLSYRLTGVKIHEYTDATTTGLVNAEKREYDEGIISALGFDATAFGKLTFPGSFIGFLKKEIAEEVGGNAAVIAAPSHDTAAAVEGMPLTDGDAYISSGTWSLIGVKLPRPDTGKQSLAGNWSNEGGVGYIRYQKNVMGLWLVQSLRKEICPELSFGEMTELAEQSGFRGVTDINAPEFLAPGSMAKTFLDAFPAGEAPVSVGDFVRAALNSLAAAYADSLKELRSRSDVSVKRLVIAGGGAKNRLLNSLTAGCAGVPVVALPTEATALGNLKTQFRAFENPDTGYRI